MDETMDEPDSGPISWRRALVVLLAVIGISAVALVFTGTQVSKILSTVGSSVSPNCCDVVSGNGKEGSGAGEPAGGGGTAGDGAPLLDASRPDLLIIKTGEITVQAKEIAPAVQAVTDRIVALGGYASGSTRSGSGEEATASLTFRVPAHQWEAALAAARGAGDDVLEEHTETADVTGDVVDLHARIRNLQATEAAIQAIMDRAGTITDVLEVQARLSEVQGEIEQLTAKAADLEERAAYSTLVLNVRMRPAPVVARQEAKFDPRREVEGAAAQLVGILQSVATAGIWFGIVWLPILVALAVLGFVGFFVWRRLVARGGGGNVMASPEGGA